MYVKAMQPRVRGRAHEQEARLFATGPNVNYGTLIVEQNPAEVCWADEVMVERNALCHVMLKDDDKPDGVGSVDADGQRDGRPWWLVRYAWWWANESTSAQRADTEDHTIEMLVTQGDLYVLNDSGDTVERVR